MSQQPEPFYSFITGDIRHSEPASEKDFYDQLRKLEAIMIEYNIVKIDIAINPHLYPKILLKEHKE